MKKVTIIILSCCCLVLLTVSVFSVFMAAKSQQNLDVVKNDLEQLEIRFSSYQKEYKNLEKENEDLKLKQSDKLTNALNFYDDYIVIVPYNAKGEMDTCYHQYGCFDSILSGGKFEVYTLKEAKSAGYKPCECVDSSKIESYTD